MVVFSTRKSNRGKPGEIAAGAHVVEQLLDRVLPDCFRSVQRGAAAFTEDRFAGIRNPTSHEDGLPELPQHEALEQLAAFSVTVPARRVDTAALAT
ncbi:TIGR02391 family protein [Streptomyces europaeiscabiei]|uniref:TIGR02391 family protein n=1 Tax=Streptomyces europaeiscabiei TaxID=146819 RepID=UPI002E128830|nr:TIGR02391 family protein [Streptomyces europaeiscabiei]